MAPVAASDTVYFLGAGFNSALAADTGPPYEPEWMYEDHWKAPLSRDLFQLQIAQEMVWDRHAGWGRDALLAYIKRYFRLTEAELATEPFDLEECFTLLQLQFDDAVRRRDADGQREFGTLFNTLVALLAIYLQEFGMTSGITAWGSHSSDAGNVPSLGARFAKTILKTDSTIITFNYDTLVEDLLEHASGQNRWRDHIKDVDWREKARDRRSLLTDDVIAYCDTQWSRACAYGFEFDFVPLRAGPPRRSIPRAQFYRPDANKLYPPRLLKLHGSLNWFRYAADSAQRTWQIERGDPYEVVGKLHDIALGSHDWYTLNHPMEQQGWDLAPVIVPPLLNKNYAQEPFIRLWPYAAQALRHCRTLVVVGYSFPPTDFPVRKLVREAFADRRPARVVNVNDDERPGGSGESGQRLTELLGRDFDLEHCASLEDLDHGLLLQAPLRWFWDGWTPTEHQAWFTSHSDAERQAQIDAEMERANDWWEYRWERPW